MAELDKKPVRLEEPFASSLAMSRCTVKAMWLTRLIYGQRKFRHFIIWRDDVLCRLHAGHYEYEPTLSAGSQIGCTVLSSRMGNFKQLRGKNSGQTFA